MKTKLSFPHILTSFFFLLALCPSPCALSQIPQGFNYQAVAHNSAGAPIMNTIIQVKMGILSDTLTPVVVWEELHSSVKTNASGIFGLVIGTGTRQSGSAASFSDIDWTKTPLYLKIQLYFQGSWKTMGHAKLWSVPYAMVADKLDGPVSKLEVTGSATTQDESLFEVKNKDGQTIFAVYNEGVRVYVSEGDKKGVKGGFAIGGFGTTKASSQPYFIVRPDSIRMYLYDTVKAVKGGFAIGGYGTTKAGSQDYLFVSSDSIRAYIDNTTAKGVKGGFAIGGFGTVKDQPGNYFDVSTDTGRIVNPSQNRILWYPLKNAFLAGRVLIEKPDSVGINSFATGYESKAKGQYSQAMGYKTIARGDYATAIGKKAIANSINSFALGDNAKALNQDSYAFGAFSEAKGVGSFAFGYVGRDSIGPTGKNTIASGNYSFAFGLGSQATGESSFAFGADNLASNYFSMAYGLSTKSTGGAATTFGYNTMASEWASMAIGQTTEASAFTSFAGGLLTKATGAMSVALGNETKASGAGSTALGYRTSANSDLSIAIGQESKTSGYAAFSGGQFSIASGNNSFAFGYKANALSGGAFAFGDSTVASGWASVAFGFRTEASGGLSFAEGYLSKATGWYAVALGKETKAIGTSSTAWGENTQAIGDNCTAFGIGSTASNYASTAIGIESVASGQSAFAGGKLCTASGAQSFAFGYQSKATGVLSVALGNNTTAVGTSSSAFGYLTKAKPYASFVIGQYNDTSCLEKDWWTGLDPVFVIGNGSSDINRKNALTVLQNGNTGIAMINPQQKLDIAGGNGRVESGYNWLTDSDIRYKKNILTLESSLEKVMALRGVSFDMINENSDSFNGRRNIGFIAQEMETVIPEVVFTDPNGYKSVAYDKITAVLSEAIKEQQLLIESQQKQIDELKAILNTLMAADK
ncbi:MAG: tail fiber domain-containing protein [Bacteroidia bacterium]|nr:tail fiber domain-containing protein [Bacteroidia bacterium]